MAKKKRFIPAKVTAAITTIIVALIFLELGLPDKTDIASFLVDLIYGLLRPVLTGPMAEYADQLYGIANLIIAIAVLAGLLSLAWAVLVVAKWVKKKLKL